MNEPERPPIPRPELERDLKRLYAPRVDVPTELERRVLESARLRLGVARRRPWGRRVAAAAAALTLAGLVWLAVADRDPGGQPELAEPALPGDLDANGQVDIVDALVLARRIDRGLTQDLRFDFNGDGVVDRGDVDRIAQNAVRLR